MFDEYSLRVLKLDSKTNTWVEECHSERRDGLYESVFLTYFVYQNVTNILNSRIIQKGKYRHIQLEISEKYDHYNNDTCLFLNQTMFEKKIGFPIKYNFKLDMFNKTYTMKSSHSGKSFMLSLGRHSVHSIDWNEDTGVFQFFDSFRRKSEIIDILANNQKNSIALVHIREDDSLYLIHRELDTKKNLVSESYHKLLSSTFYELVSKTGIKDMRIETIDRGEFEESILLVVFSNGVFATFDLNLI
jgi:hypothetical protein